MNKGDSIKIQINKRLYQGEIVYIGKQYLKVKYLDLTPECDFTLDEIMVPIDENFSMPDILKVWTRNTFAPRLIFRTIRLIEG